MTRLAVLPVRLSRWWSASLLGERPFARLPAPRRVEGNASRYGGVQTALASMFVLIACGSGPLPPVTLDARGDACASCRMAVSAAGVVAQLVAPGEDPRFFDDIGCLASFLKDHAEQPAGATAYVVDHRTRTWVRADTALYTRVPDLETPMGSHLVAHADEGSRLDDSVSARGSAATNADVFGARMPPGGTP